MLLGGPLWIFLLAWLSALNFTLQWFGFTLGSELDQPVQQFMALCLISGPCSDSSCGLSFQEERGSDRAHGVWFCIALPDKNILSLYGITENFNSIPKTSLPSQSIFLALSMLGSTDSCSRTCRIEWSWQNSC